MSDQPEKLPMEHIERAPLPWRDETLTECGLPTAGHPVITRAAWLAKLRQQGKQRAAFTTCMTCWDAACRNSPWNDDPVRAIDRAASDWRRKDQFAAELRAIALLVDAHRDEFREAMAGLADVGDLAARRRARRRGA
jgi:hypothetical protein